MSRRAALTAAVIAVVAVVVIGRTLTSTEQPTPRTPSTASAPEDASTQPSSWDHGIPVGYPNDHDGARSAALAYMALTAMVATSGPLTRADMIDALAAPSYADELTAATTRQVDELIAPLNGPAVLVQDLVWVETPLSAEITPTPTGVRAAVWSVVVVANPTSSVARQLWRTVYLDLEWDLDRWRVQHWSATPGPTPALPTHIDLADGAQVRRVATWAPAASFGRP